VAEWSKEFYVVSVSGMRAMGGGAGSMGGGGDRQPREGGGAPPEGGQRRGGQQGGPGQAVDPQQRMAQMRDRMKESTTLKVNGKGAIPPARIEMLRTSDGQVTVFLFPRVNSMQVADKELLFETAMGPMEVKAKFALREMAVKGKLEL